MGKRVVGVVGQIGAGKDTLGHLIETLLDFKFLNISDLVRVSAKAAGVSNDRSSLTAFSTAMLSSNGSTYFVNQAITIIRALDSFQVVVSGVRTTADVSAFTAAFGHGFCLVAVGVADPELRYARITERGDFAHRLGPIDARLDDIEQEHLFNISETTSLARLHVDNSGSTDDLASWVLANAPKLRA